MLCAVHVCFIETPRKHLSRYPFAAKEEESVSLSFILVNTGLVRWKAVDL